MYKKKKGNLGRETKLTQGTSDESRENVNRNYANEQIWLRLALKLQSNSSPTMLVNGEKEYSTNQELFFVLKHALKLCVVLSSSYI